MKQIMYTVRLVVRDYGGAAGNIPGVAALSDRHRLEAADPLHQDTPIDENPVFNKTLLPQS